MSPRSEPARSSLAAFFALVFGTTWLLQLPAILVQRGHLPGPMGRYLPLVVLGYFTPLIAALVLARRDFGGEGVLALLGRFRPRQVAPAWYLLALAHAAAILSVGMFLGRIVLGSRNETAFYPPTAPAQFAAMLVIPFTEQIPWRGFVYPRLEERLGPLGASLVVGAGWALFHLQKQSLLGPGLAPSVAVWTLLLMTAGTVVFTWFYRRTGSMVVVVLANAGVYLDNPTSALPANVTPLALDALGYCAVAVLLLWMDRSVWRMARRPLSCGRPVEERP